MTQFELDRPRWSSAWTSMSLYRPAATNELLDWFEERGVDISGVEGTALESIGRWDDLESEAWSRIEAAAPAEVARWSRLASAAVPLDAMTEMVLTVMDKDVTARGLDLPSLREVARLR